jgi:hypothetical protein
MYAGNGGVVQASYAMWSHFVKRQDRAWLCPCGGLPNKPSQALLAFVDEAHVMYCVQVANIKGLRAHCEASC